MRNIKVVIEYDGTDYFGFQRQPGRRTIQGEIERALTKITKKPVKVVGAGRTDAGVHALGQVISFKTGGTIPTEKIAVAMNSLLPKDIVAGDAREVPPEFHARYSAKSRAYKYIVLNRKHPSAFFGRFSWYVPGALNLAAMRRGAKYLVGTHDFTSFSAADTDRSGRIREVKGLLIRRCDEFVTFDLEANAFLHSMARIMVGTLVEVGQGRRRAAEIGEVLESKDRRLAGRTAPPQGLALVEVTY
ncbi:MAG: tRNA pseudouridine(38-40) synthase TruA [Armatimonadetes bacterium]|nr:tRNA pseudouridine(38-40) synthase TruA [Armatimonadota bacterium]